GGKLYWTDTNGPSVHRSNLDGTNSETLVSAGVISPNQLALDTPPEFPAAIPAASTWGLAVLSLTLLAGGTCILRRPTSVGS
ncbi:MAG: hypothetical protein AABZ12_11205, partial [Planctomycetota bacterium]